MLYYICMSMHYMKSPCLSFLLNYFGYGFLKGLVPQVD